MPIIYKEADMSINYGRRERSTSFCAVEKQKTVMEKTQKFLLQYLLKELQMANAQLRLGKTSIYSSCWFHWSL